MTENDLNWFETLMLIFVGLMLIMVILFVDGVNFVARFLRIKK